jgi:thermitase
MKRRPGTANAIAIIALLIIGLIGPNKTQWVAKAESQDESAQTAPKFVPGRVLVQFQPETTRSRSRGVIAQSGASDAGEIAGTGVHILELPAGADEHAVANTLKSQPEVEFAELDRIVAPATVTPNDFWYSSEWHLPRIAAGDAWPITTGSSSITIAICDTGVDGTHPDLSAKMVPGRNVYNNNSDTTDVHGHGTQVAGAAASCSNNGIGVASIAWGCMIMPIRISDSNGNAAYSAMANAVTWAADHGARVANISYIATDSATVKAAAQYMQSRGGVVTVAAGNYSTFDSTPDNPYVLTISATNMSDVLSDFSNYGNNIDLAAPEAVYTTTRGGGYSYQGGTSFSAPIVAGVAALMLSANPNLTGAQVQDILKQNADDLGTPGWDSSYGAGRVNAARAVNAVSGGGVPDTMPPAVSFLAPAAGSVVSGTVSVQLAASDNVSVSSVSLSVDGTLFGTDNASPYAFLWNTALMNDGQHTLRATANDAAGNATSASVLVTVRNAADTAPPTITITSPQNGSTVSGNVSVLVNAADNVGVVRVELYVDGGLTAVSASAPFTTKWNSRRATTGAHTIQAKAYDAAGNACLSQTVTVTK